VSELSLGVGYSALPSRLWSVTVRRHGERRFEPANIVQSEEPLTIASVDLVLSAFLPDDVPRVVPLKPGDPSPDDWPGIESIETWRHLLAEDELREGSVAQSTRYESGILPVGTGALARFVNGSVVSLAWHDPGFVVVDLRDVADARVRHKRSQKADSLITEARRSRPGVWPFNRVRSWIEWHVVSGQDCLYGHGETPLRFRRGTLRIAEGATYAVGTVVRFAGRRGKLSQDPTFARRLSYWTQTHSALSDEVKNIEEAPTSDPPVHASVYVHGTVSCGIRYAPLLKDVMPGAKFRFEHDTFLPLQDNAERLADQIERSTAVIHPGGRLHLIGHSRGGLVARRAAAVLMTRFPQIRDQIDITTLGTPHGGTPLAGASVLAIKGLLRSGVLGAGLLGVPDPVSAALPYLIAGRRQRPDGLAAMAVGSGELAAMNSKEAHSEPDCASFAGIFDLDRDPAAIGPRLKHAFGRGVFRGEPNDLVVSEKSATRWGVPLHASGSCGHSDYLTNFTVRLHLDTLSGSSAAVRAGAALARLRETTGLNQAEALEHVRAAAGKPLVATIEELEAGRNWVRAEREKLSRWGWALARDRNPQVKAGDLLQRILDLDNLDVRP